MSHGPLDDADRSSMPALPAGMRDLLPEETREQARLARKVMKSFGLFGYDRVAVPAFEFARVLQRGQGDVGTMLRFLEPESGEIVALRPDMTPQVARLVAARLAERPSPVRLCYEGSVLRRRLERSQRRRQMRQAGFELMGLGGPRGDLEVITVAAAAMERVGLDRYVIDVGHVGIASSLLQLVAPERRPELIDALSVKDQTELARRATSAGLGGAELRALVALPELHGRGEVWDRAEAALTDTPAAGPARDLKLLWEAAREGDLADRLTVDLGETWNFSYYTGLTFHVHAEGPGEPVGSGGRYDELLARYGMARPAAGFAFDVDHLAWACLRRGVARGVPSRVAIDERSVTVPVADRLATALRSRKVPACGAADGAAHGGAWGFSHVLRTSNGALRLEPTAAPPASAVPDAGVQPADSAIIDLGPCPAADASAETFQAIAGRVRGHLDGVA